MKTITDLIRNSVYKVLLIALFTVALLVASISVGGKPAQAQSASQTVADLLDGVSIPGLDSLPVSNLQITDSYKSVDVTVHGQMATIVIFKPSGADKNVVAVIPNDFSLGNFVPLPSGTPLDDVTFSDMAFIIAQGNVSLVKADAPTPLSAALSHGGDTVTLKQGVNIFGQADFTASNTVSSALSMVGITDLILPLNGSLPANLFSQNPATALADFKNHVLDNLDLSIPLPAMSIPGVSSVNISSSTLTIKGKNDGGTRSIDVDFKGQLDITHGSTNADFDFDIDIVNRGGVNKLLFSATETPGSSLTVSMFKTITLTNMTFGMDNYKAAGWTTRITADATINNNAVHLNLINDPDNLNYVKVLTTGLKLSQLIDSPGLPGLDDVELDWLEMSSDALSMGVQIKGISSLISVFKQQGASGHFIAWIPATQDGGSTSITPAQFIPEVASTPLNDVTFEDMAFVYSPVSSSFNLVSETLPAGLEGLISRADSTLTVKHGLNVFGHIDVQPTGEMETLLGKIGITDISIPLNGKFSKSAFGDHSIASIKSKIMDALDLNITLPTPSISGLSALTFSNGKLHVKGTLPDGTAGIALSVSGDASVSFGSDTVDLAMNIEFDRALNGTETELNISSTTTVNWDNPFGITWIDLTSLGVTFDETITNGVHGWDVTATANTTIGAHSDLDVTIAVIEENGTLTDATFGLTGPIDLSEIPGLKDIPEINDLTINTITVSMHGISATTTFQTRETDFYAFETNSNWVIALSQDNFKISEIIPPLASTPLDHVTLSEASILYAQTAISGTMSSFGPIAQAAFRRIYGTNQDGTNVDATINVAQGINIIAAFEHSRSTGLLTGGFSRLGMNQEKIILVGDIGGIMGDTNPHVNLQATLDTHGSPSHMPSWLSFADDATFVFSLFASFAGDDLVMEFGIGVDVTATVHSDTLTFDSKLAMEVQEENIDIKFVMDLKTGNKSDGLNDTGGLNCTLTNTPAHSAPAGPAGWHNPFGIAGFTLYNVAMDVGIDVDGAIHLGFAGGAKVGSDRFCVAADADLLPEALGMPTDIAFIGAADSVDMLFPQNLALQIVADLVKSGDMSVPISHLPSPEFKNVRFAFVTPGASDPDLHIQGEGVAMKGSLYWLGKTLGSVDIAVGPTIGIKIDGTIGPPKPDGTAGDLTIGPISLKNTYLDFKIPIPPKDPLSGYFKLNADLTIPEIGFDDAINSSLTSTGMSISITETLLSDFSETITLALTGVDLSLTSPSLTKADFAISGALQADFGDFIKTALTTTFNDVFKELNKDYQKGIKDIAKAQKKVDSLNVKINHERAVVRAERAKVEASLHSAQARVDSIQSDIDHDWHKYHHCGGWFPWPCKIRWGIAIGVEKAVKEVADVILEAVEELVAHVPIDFDPRIWGLLIAKDSATVALDLAKDTIIGLEDLNNLATKGLDKIANFAGGAVNLKNASFNADLKDVITGDKPADLNIDIELFGAEFKETFAFSLGSASSELANLGKAGAQDTAHLALLAYVGVDHLFDKVLDDIPAPFKRKLRGMLGKRIHDTQIALQNELMNDKTLFAKYHKTAQALQTTYTGFSDSYNASMMQKRITMLDKEPASKTFTDAQFELASTGICLTVGAARNHSREKQYNSCAAKGEENSNVSYTKQKISTENLLYTKGKNKGKPTGYVKIGIGTNTCLTVPGKWAFEDVTYDQQIVEQEVYNPFTYKGEDYEGDEKYGRPKFVDCSTVTGERDADPQFQWKILPHGEDYFQIHNRATQTCIWMKSVGDGYGDSNYALRMIPCVGANTGVFRIADAAPAILHSVNMPLKRGYYLPSEDYESVQLCVSPPDSSNNAFSWGSSDNNISWGSSDNNSISWGSCDKPYDVSDSTNNYNGYDTFDYFEDNLGRRRYVSKKKPNKCLEWNYPGLSYKDCDSTMDSQWLVATPVVGGLTLSDPDLSRTSRLKTGDKFPDPNKILFQPLNPRAGAEWSDKVTNYSGTGFDTAYTGAQQAVSAINARATAWEAIKTGLAAKTDDLAGGKQACVKSGKNNYCYRLGPQTGYVAKAVQAGQTLTQLTDGTPIIADDVSDAQAKKLATIATMKEPKWFICRTKAYVTNDSRAGMYFPGVVVNQNNCVFSEGSTKNNSYGGFHVMKGETDLFWQPAGNGYLPSSSLITGRLNLNTATGTLDSTNRRTRQLIGSTMAVYSCRAMVDRKTKIGWTIGGKYCHITTFAGGAVVKNFEVLTVNGSIAAPPPPPPPPGSECTYQMVENYLYGRTWESHCAPYQYDQLHPDCHFMSRRNGWCDGGPQQDDGGI